MGPLRYRRICFPIDYYKEAISMDKTLQQRFTTVGFQQKPTTKNMVQQLQEQRILFHHHQASIKL